MIVETLGSDDRGTEVHKLEVDGDGLFDVTGLELIDPGQVDTGRSEPQRDMQ